MAKKHKNIDKIPIKWNGALNHVDAGNINQNIPASHNFTWGGHGIDGYIRNPDCPRGQKSRTEPECWWEDYDMSPYPIPDGEFNVADIAWWNDNGGTGNLVDLGGSESIDGGIAPSNGYLLNIILGIGGIKLPVKASEGYGPNTFTWGDVSFIQEIVDGIGTGGRRIRQGKLDKLLKDEQKRKRIIHLICRVKGEKVYDGKKEVGSTNLQVKVEDVDVMVNEVFGKIKVETKDVL